MTGQVTGQATGQLSFLADRIQLEFETFHRAHPEVYRTLVDLAREYRRAGRATGIGHLWEVMRWTLGGPHRDGAEFRLNNNFRSRYVRLIERQEPDLRGFFETRRLTSQSVGVVGVE